MTKGIYFKWLDSEELDLYRYLCKEKAIKLDEYCHKRGITKHDAMVLINKLKKKDLVRVKYNPKIYVVDG
jgi:DNA-binding MarR family transcriptional regulator